MDPFLSYFSIQLTNSIILGGQSRGLQKQSSTETSKLKKELTEASKSFQEEQLDKEIAFMRECLYLGLEKQINLTKISCSNIYKETEFKKFCENWNLHFKINISTILNELTQLSYEPNNIVKPKLMIARSKVISTEYGDPSKTDIRGKYYDFCQDLIDEYHINEDFDVSWINAWEKDCISPISDTINLHYIMQGLPTILIFPCYKEDEIIIKVATWGFSTGKTNLCFNNLFSINKSYFKEDSERLQLAVLAAALFINDSFRTVFFQKEDDLVSKYQVLFSNHELLWNTIQKYYLDLKSNISLSSITESTLITHK